MAVFWKRMAQWMALSIMMMPAWASAGDIDWDPRIVRGKLDNGLSYFVHDSGKADDPFNIRLIVHAGSVDEDAPGGVAHIVEHMVFRTNRNRPQGIHHYIEDLGWRQGVQVNAVTRESETQFMIRTRPNDALDLAGSLALLRDLTFGASLTEADWQNERAVILEELHHTDSIADRISLQKKNVLREGSRYAGRSTIGTQERIETVTIEEIREFHGKFYTASNMTLILSGRIDATNAEQLIRDLFGGEASLPKPDRDYLAFPLKYGLTVGVAQDRGGTSSKTIYAFRMAMPDRLSDAGQMAYLEKYFLDRLIRVEIRKHAAAYAPSIESLGLALQETTDRRLILAFSASSADHDASLKALLDVIERIRREGLSKEEFDSVMAAARRINTRNAGAAESRLYTDWEDRIASALLIGSVLDDPIIRSERTGRLLDRITLEKLEARLRGMLSEPDQVVLYQVPGGRDFDPPSASQIAALRNDLAAPHELSPRSKADVSQAHEEKSPSPKPLNWPADALVPTSGKLLSERLESDPQVIEWALSNGDRVAWLIRDTADGKVYLSARSGAGFMNNAFGSTVSQASLQLWQQSGFRFWTQEEYDSWQEARSAGPSWAFTLKADELDVAAVMQPEEIPAMLEDYARRIAFGTVRQEAVNAFRAQSQGTSHTDYGHEQLIYDTPAEDISDIAGSLTPKEMEDTARRLLTVPVTWFVVGKRPNDAVRQAFASTAGAIQRTDLIKAAPRLQREGRHHHRIGTPVDGRSEVRISFFAPLDWTPEASFLLSTLNPLTQQALKDELRYRRGGIYTLRFEMKVDPASNRAIGTLSFDSRADRAEELAAAAQNVLRTMPEIARLADVERIREDIRFAESLRLEDSNTWLRRLALSYRRYGNAGYLQRADTLDDQVSGKRLGALARGVFTTQNVAVMITDH